MKTHQDPRHLKRIRAMQDLFAWEFQADKKLKTKNIEPIIEHLTQIDKEIKTSAPAWPIEKINKIDLSILRLAVFELIIAPRFHRRCVISKKGDIMEKGTPYKVVVDEAVELAKEFGTEASPGFINGALGNIISGHGLDNKKGEKSE